MASETGSASPVFGPTMLRIAFGEPDLASWLGLNSRTPFASCAVTQRSPEASNRRPTGPLRVLLAGLAEMVTVGAGFPDVASLFFAYSTTAKPPLLATHRS